MFRLSKIKRRKTAASTIRTADSRTQLSSDPFFTTSTPKAARAASADDEEEVPTRNDKDIDSDSDEQCDDDDEEWTPPPAENGKHGPVPVKTPRETAKRKHYDNNDILFDTTDDEQEVPKHNDKDNDSDSDFDEQSDSTTMIEKENAAENQTVDDDDDDGKASASLPCRHGGTAAAADDDNANDDSHPSNLPKTSRVTFETAQFLEKFHAKVTDNFWWSPDGDEIHIPKANELRKEGVAQQLVGMSYKSFQGKMSRYLQVYWKWDRDADQITLRHNNLHRENPELVREMLYYRNGKVSTSLPCRHGGTAAAADDDNANDDSHPSNLPKTSRVSLQTAKFLEMFHATVTDNFWWSPDGDEIHIPNAKKFAEKGGVCEQLFEKCYETLQNLMSSRLRVDWKWDRDTDQITLRHDNLHRDKRSLVRDMLYYRVKYGNCKCCKFLGGKDAVANHVDCADMMCKVCRDFHDGYLGNDEYDEEVHRMLESFRDKHCATNKHRNDLRNDSSASLALRQRMDDMKAAKDARDPEEMVRIILEAPSVKRRHQLIDRLKAQGDPTGHLKVLEELDRLFVKYPYALGAFATDSTCWDDLWILEVKGASANICHVVAGMVYEMKILCEEQGSVFDAPKYTSRLKFEFLGASHGVIFGERIDHDDYDGIEDVMGWAKPLDELRKKVQVLNGGKVTHRKKNKTPPEATLEDLAILIVETIPHPQLQKKLLDVVDGTINDNPKNILLMQNALCFGTFYCKIRTCMQAPWLDEYYKFGFGGSGYTARFNAKLFWELVGLVEPENRLEWLCLFVLSFAAFDGSVWENYFEVIVPLDNSNDSLSDTMLMIFEEIFGDVHVKETEEPSQLPDGKDIMRLRINRVRDRVKVANVLLPYADGFLTEDRLENLQAWAA